MKKSLITITRGIICLIGIAVFAVCAILLPEIAREEAISNPNPDRLTTPFLVGAWILALPIFTALYQTWKFLKIIEENKAFSSESVKVLQIIKNCTVLFSALIAASAIIIVILGRSADPQEDVAPIITFGVIFTFVSIVIATFTAVLQRLMQNAIDLKKENDLTV